MYESMNEAGDAILSSFFLSLTTNLFESELSNRVGEATGYNHRVGEWQTQANNNGMIGAKVHKHCRPRLEVTVDLAWCRGKEWQLARMHILHNHMFRPSSGWGLQLLGSCT